MANNCLKTQLKESVNNDNLLKLGALRFLYKANDFNNAKSQNITIGTNANYPLTMEIVGNNGYISEDYQTPTTSKKEEWNGANKTWAVGPNTSDIVFDVYPVYNVHTLYIGGSGDGEFKNHVIVNPEMIAYMTKLNNLTVRECGKTFILNTSAFKNLLFLTNLDAGSFGNFEGDIADIKSTRLAQAYLSNCTKLTGELDQVSWLGSIGVLDIRNTPNIHKKRSTINYLTNRGCTVNYYQDEIDEDV